MEVDPKVYELAALFVDDVLDTVWRATPTKWPSGREAREQLVKRAAEAIQQAIEDECNAIEEELRS